MDKPLQKGFRSHFIEATEINTITKRYYAERTEGKSLTVSRILIYSEKLLYPVAWYFDWRAKKYNSKGIGVIANDFVSLQNIQPVDAKPLYTNRLTIKDIRELFVLMFSLRRRVRVLLRDYNFIAVNQVVTEYIQLLSYKEKTDSVHITMLKHILESVAFAAKNAIEYSKVGDRGVMRLASCFIKTQMLGTIMSPLIDRTANKIHVLGVGIIVNDIPPIPYRLE